MGSGDKTKHAYQSFYEVSYKSLNVWFGCGNSEAFYSRTAFFQSRSKPIFFEVGDKI